MDTQQEETTVEESVYVPRPKWQVWGARIVLAIFILFLIAYYANIMNGGL